MARLAKNAFLHAEDDLDPRRWIERCDGTTRFHIRYVWALERSLKYLLVNHGEQPATLRYLMTTDLEGSFPPIDMRSAGDGAIRSTIDYAMARTLTALLSGSRPPPELEARAAGAFAARRAQAGPEDTSSRETANAHERLLDLAFGRYEKVIQAYERDHGSGSATRESAARRLLEQCHRLSRIALGDADEDASPEARSCMAVLKYDYHLWSVKETLSAKIGLVPLVLVSWLHEELAKGTRPHAPDLFASFAPRAVAAEMNAGREGSAARGGQRRIEGRERRIEANGGTAVHLLFVSRATGTHASTAAQVYAALPGIEVRARTVERGDLPVSRDDLEWATHVFAVDRESKHQLKEVHREALEGKQVHAMSIPGEHETLPAPLVEQVRREVSAVLHRAAEVKIYDLELEQESVARMQRLSVASRPVGVTTEHGLVGSAAWWQAIADGRLATRTESGVVMKVVHAKSGTHYWMKSKGADRYHRCLRSKSASPPLTRQNLEEIYLPGSHVRIRTAEARARMGGRLPVVLEVWLSPPQPGDGPVPALAED